MSKTFKDVDKRFDEEFGDGENQMVILNTPSRMIARRDDIKSFYRKEFISLLEGLKEENASLIGNSFSLKFNAKIDKLIEGNDY